MTHAAPSELLRAMRRQGLALGLLTLAAVLLLAAVRELTREEISRQREAAEQRALQEVLGLDLDAAALERQVLILQGGEGWLGLERLGLRPPLRAWRFLHEGAVAGLVLPLRSNAGYGGPIDLRLGVGADGRLRGVRVIEHHETPGLGDGIDLRVSDWILAFDGRTVNEPPAPRWTVRKEGGDFDQFVGATVTPRAVVRAVHAALTFVADNRAALLEAP